MRGRRAGREEGKEWREEGKEGRKEGRRRRGRRGGAWAYGDSLVKGTERFICRKFDTFFLLCPNFPTVLPEFGRAVAPPPAPGLVRPWGGGGEGGQDGGGAEE